MLHSLDELLRLADRVVLMENGIVQAYDSVEKIWNSPIFAPWKGETNRAVYLPCLFICIIHLIK